MKEPLVTVIICIYNQFEFLDKSLRSIIDQTYKNLQIIILDDNSSDFPTELTLRIINDDPRISYIKIDTQLNVGSVRNLGLLLARGDYIVFVDADDWIEPTFIQAHINAFNYSIVLSEIDSKVLLEKVRKTPDLVTCKIWREKPDKTEIVTGDAFFLVGNAFPSILNTNFDSERLLLHYNSSVYKKSVFEQFGGFMDQKILEDAEFITRLCFGNMAIKILGDPLYHYKRNANSLTQSLLGKDEWVEIAKKFHERIEKMRETTNMEEFMNLFRTPISLPNINITDSHRLNNITINTTIPTEENTRNHIHSLLV